MKVCLSSVLTCLIALMLIFNWGCKNQAMDEVLSQLPDYNPEKDIINHEWHNEEPVSIIGYNDDVMEIGLSPDEEFLLFNDKNEPDKDMHWAKRLDDKAYQYQGKVSNTVSKTVDGTPGFAADASLYFTTLKSYPNDVRTIYKAEFVNGVAVNPLPVDGNIYVSNFNTIGGQLWVSLDPDLSENEFLLFYSEGCFRPGVGFPYPFNVRGAEKVAGKYQKLDDKILANINSRNLEYAPAISANGLELFFSRIAKVNGQLKFIGIFVARRNSLQEPFSLPEKINAISGDVEAPALSTDENHLYYHRLVNGRFKAYRVTRKNSLKHTH